MLRDADSHASALRRSRPQAATDSAAAMRVGDFAAASSHSRVLALHRASRSSSRSERSVPASEPARSRGEACRGPPGRSAAARIQQRAVRDAGRGIARARACRNRLEQPVAVVQSAVEGRDAGSPACAASDQHQLGTPSHCGPRPGRARPVLTATAPRSLHTNTASSPRALARVSSSSRSGIESATMPPPGAQIAPGDP